MSGIRALLLASGFVLAPAMADAATLTFTQSGWPGGGVITLSFDFNDTNGDRRVESNEVTAWSAASNGVGITAFSVSNTTPGHSFSVNYALDLGLLLGDDPSEALNVRNTPRFAYASGVSGFLLTGGGTPSRQSFTTSQLPTLIFSSAPPPPSPPSPPPAPTPVPEPASLALFGLALAGLVAGRRRARAG